MDTFSFAFTNGSVWIYLLAVVIAALLAWVSYRRTVPELDSPMRVVLIGLRTLALALLIVTLFEPLIRFIRSDDVTPRVALLVDQSSSDGMKDKAGDRAVQVKTALGAVADGAEAEIDIMAFAAAIGEPMARTAADTLHFTGHRTDIGGALRSISNRSEERHYGAIVLISDGNDNVGDGPVYVAERSGLPVIAIGIGDTVPPKDLAVQSLLTNPVGFVGQPLPVTVEVTTENLPDGEATAVLYDNGAEVARQKVPVRSGHRRSSVTFTYTPKSDGIRKLGVDVEALPGEFTTKNNRAQEFVRIVKNKRRIVLFAGAPSADVSFFRNALSEDPTVEIKTFIQRQGADFYEGMPQPTVLDDAEACILIGFPVSSTPQAILSMIGAACGKGVSLLFIPSQGVDYSKIGPLEDVLPFRVQSSRNQEFLVSPDVARGSTSDPILKLTGTERDAELWNDLPPIYRTETFVRPAPGSVVLSTVRFNNVPMQDPLVIKRETDRTRSLAVMGYGLYRWRLLGAGPARARGEEAVDVLSLFVGNSIRWLSVKDQGKRVRIRPTRSFYASGETVEITGNVLDASYAAVDGADVKVRLRGAGFDRTLVLAPRSNGRYMTTVGILPAGDYSYEGTATLNGQALGTDNGRFSVGDVSIEDAATHQNRELLKLLAERSGGRYLHSAEAGKVRDVLRKLGSMKATTQTSEREVVLWHLPWLLAGAILCFALEWFMRKRRGLV